MKPLLQIMSLAGLAVLCAAPLCAQETGAVRGRVTDQATQQPLSGVTITVANRSALSQTDGRYLVTAVPAGTHTLQTRMIGYAPAPQSVTVAGGETVVVDLVLTGQAVSLSEIVVTGYGEQRLGNVTGAVSKLTSEEFNTGRIISPAELIASKAPGVQVVDNNEPGGGLTVRIRGATSVNASSEPMYVIDGMPVGTGAGGGLGVAGRDALNFVNPNEIESVTVLRDASAAAIYGANAANGVVLIETKAGRRGNTSFEYSGSASTSQITRTPSMLNAAEFRTAVQTYAPGNVAQLGTANTDWFSQVSQAAFGQDHNLSVSSASDATNWRLSLGYLNQDGIIRGTNTERASLGLNFRQQLLDDRMQLRSTLKLTRAAYDFTPGGVVGNAAQMGPTQPITDPTSPTGYYEFPNAPSPNNPVALQNLASDHGTNLRAVGNVRGEYRMPFMPALRANLNLGFDIARADRETFTPSILASEQKSGRNGNLYRNNQSQTNAVLEAYVGYASALNFMPGTVDLTGGYSYQEEHGEYPELNLLGLSTDLLGPDGVPQALTTQNRLFVEDYKLISFYGRLNWNLNDRYLVAVSLRRDGSSRFGPDKAWGTFPSVAFAWRLSRESFMSGVGALSDLKLRVSRASTGNQAFGNYQQYSTYTVGDGQTQVQFGNTFVSTIRPSAVDPNIGWEETRATNVGLDFGLWNDRITGTIDWYDKTTSDLIFNVPVAAGTNFSNYVTTNIGDMKNTGFELGLNAKLREGSDRRLAWNVMLTASHNRNELTTINPYSPSAAAQQINTGFVAGGVGTTVQVLRPGVPINSFYVYEHRRNPDGTPVWATGAGAQLAMYVDRDSNGVINNSDRRPFHSPAPDWILGLSNYMSYDNFDFGFTMRAYTGNYVYNNVASNLGTYAEVTRASPFNLHSSVLETGFETPQYLSDYYVEKASFLRLDNISVGYTLNWGGRPMRLFGTVQNAFTITGYSGVDPTSGLNGIDNNIYPRSRTFTFGSNVRF